jgi:hypothetical protein
MSTKFFPEAVPVRPLWAAARNQECYRGENRLFGSLSVAKHNMEQSIKRKNKILLDLVVRVVEESINKVIIQNMDSAPGDGRADGFG